MYTEADLRKNLGIVYVRIVVFNVSFLFGVGEPGNQATGKVDNCASVSS